MIETFDESVEVAGKILLRQGRISLKDIRHLRTVDGEQEAIAVFNNLIGKHDVDIVEDRWNRQFTLYIRRPGVERRRRTRMMRSPFR